MTDDLTKRLLAKSFKDTSRLAEIIRDYKPGLELRWIPNAQRVDPTEEATPYCIVNNLSNGGEQLVFYLTEAEVANPPGVLARLFNSDHSKHPSGAVLRRIENSERAKAIWEEAKHAEEMEEALDFWRSVWNSPKHTFKHNGVKMDV
jgi:hypothetical protein